MPIMGIIKVGIKFGLGKVTRRFAELEVEMEVHI